LEEPLVDPALKTLQQAYVLEDRSAIPAFVKQLLQPSTPDTLCPDAGVPQAGGADSRE
jgi:hypothetical protein